LYGSGFPKSLDVSKAIDKAAGAEREVIGDKISPDGIPYSFRRVNGSGPSIGGNAYGEFGNGGNHITAPSTPEAQQWQGWGTALKPAFEPVIVARKPIEGTVANNVLKWGTGGLNIDGLRIGTEQRINPPTSANASRVAMGEYWDPEAQPTRVQGRWPANIILDPYTAELLDEQSGITKSSAHKRISQQSHSPSMENPLGAHVGFGVDDSGGASRFFYVAKASKRDRNEGLEELEGRLPAFGNDKGDGLGRGISNTKQDVPRQNFHPTVKPTSLMEYLIKLVTPPNGTVLDPFTGSGSTGKAAILQGFDFIGIEMTEEYLPIIEGRLKHAQQLVAEAKEQEKLKENEVLF
jgi:site-specific DNA-methyltransferase (adenine-specific)